jgi:hypothetical protein
MPKTQVSSAGSRRKRPTRWRIISRVFDLATGRRSHWFDHPEMRARIAEAEAERSAGLGKRFDNRDEAVAYLDSLV